MRKLEPAFFVEVKNDLDPLHQSLLSNVFEMYPNNILDNKNLPVFRQRNNTILNVGVFLCTLKYFKLYNEFLMHCLKAN